jgi:putative ATP-dependent endonuclease of OLD family
LTFERFLEIAEKLNTNVAVITDNDGRRDALDGKYEKYKESENIFISYDKKDRTELPPLKFGKKYYNYNTLENLILISNSLEKLNEVFSTQYKETNELRKHMLNNKTDCALSIFNYEKNFIFPDYIMEAIDFVSKQ